jgi:KaiC/GvpD/RAD55 family RecA-like ATPase
MQLLKTGIACLDDFLMGGLPPKVITLSGAPGSGNEIFARQILFNRAKNAAVTYFTVNVTSDSIREDMAAYGWDTAPYEETGIWKFKSLKGTPTKELIQNVRDEIQQSRTVAIDSASELLLDHKIKDIANLITDMTDQNKKCPNCHFLLITEGMQDQQAETTMNHYAAGSINFALTWAVDATMRHLIVRKMSGTIVPTRRLNYNLGRRGFIIETATRIG